MVELPGFLGTNAGAAIDTASGTVAAFPTSINAVETTSACCATATTDTNSSGEWSFSGLAANTYDIRITCGASVRWRHYSDEIQASLLQIGDQGAGCSGKIFFGNANDAAIGWVTGDASNHALAIGLGASRQLHVAEIADVGVDWARSASTNPELLLHAAACPITNYLSLLHDGTTAFIDVVGGTTLALAIAGNTEVNILATGISLPTGSDLTFAGTTGTNDIVLTNGLADALSITDGAADIMVFNTCGGTNTITITSAVNITGATTVEGGAFIFNDCGADHDARFEGLNNANLLTLDGGTDSLGLGGVVTPGAFMSITPAAQTRDMVSAVGSWLHIPADAQDINAAGNCATIAIGAAVFIGVPTWTSTATGLTLTDSATLHVAGKPIDSCNVTNTREYGILVECGGLGLGIPGGITGCLRIAGGTSGVVTLTVAAAAGTYTLTLPVNDGDACQFLQTDGAGVLSFAAGGGGPSQATQAALEAETNEDTYAPPDLIKHSPGVGKAWAFYEQTGAHSLRASYNVTSVTDGGSSGISDLLWATDMSSADYVVAAMSGTDGALGEEGSTRAAGGINIVTFNSSGTPGDDDDNSVVAFGDQ